MKKRNPPKFQKTDLIYCVGTKINRKDLKKLDALAEQYNITRSAMLRLIIKQGVVNGHAKTPIYSNGSGKEPGKAGDTRPEPVAADG